MPDRYDELRQHGIKRRNFLYAIEPHQKMRCQLLNICIPKISYYPEEKTTVYEYPPEVVKQWQYIDGIINEIAKQYNVEWFPCLT